MGAPTVSVLVTSYNRERYIGASIESVLAQTFGDFELLVTDNCSTDGTLEIARGYERIDRRVRVVVNERNLGQFGNRNRAADLAQAPLIKYHDSDDLMYSHCLAVMVPAMQAFPEAALGLSTGRDWFGGPCPMLMTPRHSFQREFLGSGMFNPGPGGAIFRADSFKALGGWIDRGAPSDYLFWLRACARERVLLLPADLLWYRVHAGQEYQSAGVERQYAETIRDTWAALADEACPLEPAERDRARTNVLSRQIRLLARDVRRGKFALAAARLAAGPSLLEWLRYARPPRRAADAGTPPADPRPQPFTLQRRERDHAVTETVER
jgi:glycosyltransferase involved in cell wall biosynthesis